jgi:hypothetical protein
MRKSNAAILQRHILHHLQRALSPHSNDDIPQRLRREPRLGIPEIIIPLTLKDLSALIVHLSLLLLDKLRLNPPLPVIQECFAPQPQRLGVVRPDILDAVDHQRTPRRCLDGGDEFGHGGEVAAGEDVAADEVVALGVRLVARVGHGDALEARHAPFLLQQLIHAREVRFEVRLPDGFEHLNGDDFVEGARGGHLERAVVAQQDGDFVCHAGFADPLFGEFFLLDGERERGHSTPCPLDGAHGEAAPPRADFEDVVGALDVCVVDEAVQLAHLRVVQGFVGGLGVRLGQPDGAGVGHVWREEGGEHLVGDVVVRHDVQLCVFEVVAAAHHACEPGRDCRGEGRAIAEVVSVQNKELGRLVGVVFFALLERTSKNLVRSGELTSPSM